jgi:hypothetical protein
LNMQADRAMDSTPVRSALYEPIALWSIVFDLRKYTAR